MANEERPRRAWGFNAFLMVACGVLCVLVVLLAIQNLRLKKQLSAPAALPESALQSGESLGALSLTDEAGETRPLEFGQGEARTLLLVFSVQCGACEKTLPVWEEMVRNLGQVPGLRIVGVQTDPSSGPGADPGTLLTPSVPFTVYRVDYQASADAMAQIPAIPATIVLDPHGVVEKVWFGILGDAQVDEVRTALGA